MPPAPTARFTNTFMTSRTAAGITGSRSPTRMDLVARAFGPQVPRQRSTQQAVVSPSSFGFGTTTTPQAGIAIAGSLGRQAMQNSCRTEVCAGNGASRSRALAELFKEATSLSMTTRNTPGGTPPITSAVRLPSMGQLLAVGTPFQKTRPLGMSCPRFSTRQMEVRSKER